MQFVPALLIALVTSVGFAMAEGAEERTIDDMFAELQEAEGAEARLLEAEIWAEWSRSGSDSMDLLLDRGRKAIEAGDYALAVDHLTALTDHAPDFAEGWNARATALFYLSRYGEAVDDIAKALTLNPRHFGAMSGLAFVYQAMDKPKMALSILREVRKLNPHQEGIDEQIRMLEKEAGEELI